MGWSFLLLSVPIALGLPFACVGLILRLCEWSWDKPAGSMGSTSILGGFGVLCLVTILGVFVLAWLATWFRS